MVPIDGDIVVLRAPRWSHRLNNTVEKTAQGFFLQVFKLHGVPPMTFRPGNQLQQMRMLSSCVTNPDLYFSFRIIVWHPCHPELPSFCIASMVSLRWRNVVTVLPDESGAQYLISVCLFWKSGQVKELHTYYISIECQGRTRTNVRWVGGTQGQMDNLFMLWLCCLKSIQWTV